MTATPLMNSQNIARTDISVSSLAFGCAMLGLDWSDPDFVAKTIPLIRAAYDQGITLFDLADVYGNGGAEAALGEVLKLEPGMRDRVIIQSKCGDRLKDGMTVDNS